MICNKCGNENPDAERFCGHCGHKLQSGRRDASTDSGSSLGPVPDLRLESKISPAFLRKFIEAWIYILLLCGATVVAVWKGVYWPLYGLIPLLALVAWLRKL